MIFLRLCVDKCRIGRTHYEKTWGYLAVSSKTVATRSFPMDVVNRGSGILSECLNQCNIDPRCTGFNYNALKQTCVGVEEDAVPILRNVTQNVLLRPGTGVSYFESNCFRGKKKKYFFCCNIQVLFLRLFFCFVFTTE